MEESFRFERVLSFDNNADPVSSRDFAEHVFSAAAAAAAAGAAKSRVDTYQSAGIASGRSSHSCVHVR
jgi:hypothetical protein